MKAKRIVALFLIASMVFSLTPGISESNDPINYMKDIVNNFLAQIKPMKDIYSYSVPTGSDKIEIESQGILIDETNNSVSLTSEVNSITFYLSDATKLEPITGWILCNIYLYESDQWSECVILRKDNGGNTTNVSDKLSEFFLSYSSAYEAQPMSSLTPRNNKWTHRYEGTVDMLIAWEMLNSCLVEANYMELQQIPPGITYYSADEQYYLLITDYEKSFVLALNSDETILALGFAVLYALHANFYMGEISYYSMNKGEESTNEDVYLHADEIDVDMQKMILQAILDAVSFENGIMEISLFNGT